MTASQWPGHVLQIGIAFAVLGPRLTANLQDATFLLRRPILLLRAVLSMNVVMPIAAALVVSTLSLPFEVRVALAVLAIILVPLTVAILSHAFGRSAMVTPAAVATIVSIPYRKWRVHAAGGERA